MRVDGYEEAELRSWKMNPRRGRLVRDVFCVLLSCFSVALTANAAARAGKAEHVAVVVGKGAPGIERYAAKQLCGYLQKLYGIQTEPVVGLASAEEVSLLVGSPTTNPEVARALGKDGWPKVSDQGIVLKRARLNGKRALVIGGGSPGATLWAVYELVHRWGVRYLLHGDVLPARPGHFALPSRDVVMEPIFRERGDILLLQLPIGTSSWGMREFKTLLDQLAKLKFNEVWLNFVPWHPFLPLSVDGISRRKACLWFCWHYPITDDMPGRFLFGDAKEFWNPDLPPDTPYEPFQSAGERLLRRLIRYGHSRGIKCSMSANLVQFPEEFKPLLKDAIKIHQLQSLTIVPGPQTALDDPGLTKLSTAVVQSTVETYPEVDSLSVWSPEFRQWIRDYKQAWQKLDARYKISRVLRLQDILPPGEANSKARDVEELKGDIVLSYFYNRLFSQLKVLDTTHRPDLKISIGSPNRKLYPILPLIYPAGSQAIIGGYYTASETLAHRSALRAVPARKLPAVMVYRLNDDNIGEVPQLNTTPLYHVTQELQADGWKGFLAMYYLSDELDPTMAYLARASWDSSTTPASVNADLMKTVCGERCVPDMLEVFRQVEQVTEEMNVQNEADGLSFPIPDMITKFMKPGPLPTELAQYREGYKRALAAARRAEAEASPDGKWYVQRWVGRLEFGARYIDCIQAVKQAATAQAEAKKARAQNDAVLAKEKQTEAVRYAQSALDTSREMLNIYARVAADRTDLAAIAVMDKYVYRQLNIWTAELRKVK